MADGVPGDGGGLLRHLHRLRDPHHRQGPALERPQARERWVVPVVMVTSIVVAMVVIVVVVVVVVLCFFSGSQGNVILFSDQ